jgi:hypothetical protein
MQTTVKHIIVTRHDAVIRATLIAVHNATVAPRRVHNAEAIDELKCSS